ncbi:hypothetical protein R80B4_02902 [Fibrobacteres bacterium R8-0-B4]
MAAKKTIAVKKSTTVKKTVSAKRVTMAKKTTAAKKSPVAKGAKAKKKPPVDQAIHYYLGPDGKVVREVLHAPEPKRLSKLAIWSKAHPKGIIKILDMKAVMR